MKKVKISLVVLTLVTVLSAGIGKAWAYFTTYAEASGGYTVSLGDKTTITEGKVVDWLKKVTIKSDPGSGPVYVRCRVFCAQEIRDKITFSGGGWSKNGEWYYYDSILTATDEKEGVAGVLDLKIPKQEMPVNPGDDVLNIIVIHESTPVKYDEDGKAYQSAWPDGPSYKEVPESTVTPDEGIGGTEGTGSSGDMEGGNN